MRKITRILQGLVIAILSTFVLTFQGTAQTTLLTEGWETATDGSNVPPTGWGIDLLGYSNITYYRSTGQLPTVAPFEGSRLVDFYSYSYGTGTTNRLKRTTAVSTVGYSNITVDFQWYRDAGYQNYNSEGVYIDWSTDGVNWNQAGAIWIRWATSNFWELETQALPVGAANQPTLYVAFRFLSQFGNDCHMDIMHVKGLQTGTLTGNVKNCSTNANLVGANVWVAAGSPPTNYTGVTNAAGNYTIAGVPTGVALPVNATATGYVPYGPTGVTILANQTTTLNFCMNPVPALLSGVVTNGTTGVPVVGAKVQTATNYTYSVGPNGAYSLSIFPAYTGTVWVTKDGFDMYQIATNTYTPPLPYAMNVGILENTNPPSQPFTAALNSGQTAVNLAWGIPTGKYQLIYDDGIEDGFAIWQAEGNLDAVKFTPVGYPATMLGCMINIGKANDYTLPGHPVTFKVGVFDATGTGGMPGAQIFPYTDFVVSATTFGWYDYPLFFGAGIPIASGSVYIVAKQVGAFPNAAGIAVDTTANQLRSFQRFVTGNGPWVPAPGNLLIRAHMFGANGPLLDNSETLVGYQVWRFLQGQESLGPVGWTSVGTPTATNIVDNSWPSLPCQSYRWAAEAQYQNNRWSNPTFSNALGKCWTANVTVNVGLSCAGATLSNAIVTLSRHNPGTPPPIYDSIYVQVTDNTGVCHFNNIYKGVYDLVATDFAYGAYSSNNITIMGDMTINATLLQIKTPPPTPPGLIVNDQSLLAVWGHPKFVVPIFNEAWASGNFTANQWQTSGSGAANWSVTGFGNPSPSAQFYYLPQIQNYDGYLTSKVFTGVHSPVLTLKYDIYLSNYATTNVNTLAVELWNGTSWVALKTYTNQSGSFNWTSESLDITSVTNSTFQIRFHTAGTDSYDINNWNLDNIKISAEGPSGNDPCVLGYNFYLNNAISGYAPDTFYNIPPGQVAYNSSFLACVAAIYGSGYSSKVCTTFTSHFLCPVTDLTASAVTNAAYLSWTKPQCQAGQDMCFNFDDGSMENGIYFNPGYTEWIGNKFIIPATYGGQIKSFNLLWWNNAGATVQPFQIDVFNLSGVLQGSSQTFTLPNPAPTTFMTITLTNPIPFTGQFYGMVKWTNFTGATHYLGMDQNGQYVNSGVGYWYDGTTWQNASALGYGACVWTVRVCAFITAQDKLMTFGPEPIAEAPQGSGSIIPASVSGAVALNPKYSLDAHDYSITGIESDSPLAGTGLLGYKVYHVVGGNDIFDHDVTGPDSLSTYVYNLDPGVQCFDVRAKYDLSVYGLPAGTTGESLNETPGPACTELIFGYKLPFWEPWNGNTLGFQGWTNDNNWLYQPAVGNPAPSANFTWQPILANYTKSLTSPTIDASAWTCASIWLDFDYKLDDRDANGTEMMDIDVMWDNKWHNKAEIKNEGSVNWTPQHIDISLAKGKGIKVRFRANGTNTQHILNWYVDNISVYGVCARPVSLNYTESHDTINLTWAPPECGPNGQQMCFIFDDGSMENGVYFNPGYTEWAGNLFQVGASVSGNLQSFDILWWNNAGATTQPFQLDVFTAAGVLIASSQTWTVPNPAPTTFMTITLANEIPFTGPFYGMVKWSAFTGATHYLGMDQNGQYVNSNVGMWYDGTTWQNASALGYGACVWTVRACAFVFGEDKVVKLGPMSPVPALAPVTKPTAAVALNPGYSLDSGDHTTMNLLDNGSDTSAMIGYNIFRYDSIVSGVVDFRKMNTGIWTNTAYTDIIPLDENNVGWYKYYVTAVFNNSVDNTFLCESPGSDTVDIHFPAVGIQEITGGTVMIYPNPVNDVVNVKSDFNISRVEVLNFIGQTVYSENAANTKLVKINTSSMQAGVYFVRVTTSKGIRTVKITVVR